MAKLLDPGHAYYVLVRGQPGPYTLYVEGPEGGATAVNSNTGSSASVAQDGYASVSGGVTISPNPIVLGKNFTVSFSLKEVRGKQKTFEDVAVAILRADNSFVFDFAHYGNVTIGATQTIPMPTKSNLLYATQTPGTYKAVIRGRYQGQWFDFGTVGGGQNPVTFSAVDSSSSTKEGDIFQCPEEKVAKKGTAWCTPQCVNYVQDMTSKEGKGIGKAPATYAASFWTGEVPGWGKHPNGGDVEPSEGDVLVWNCLKQATSNGTPKCTAGNAIGHVAYIESVDTKAGNLVFSDANNALDYTQDCQCRRHVARIVNENGRYTVITISPSAPPAGWMSSE